MLYTGVTYGAVHQAQSRARSARAPAALRSRNISGDERREREHPSAAREPGGHAGGGRGNARGRRGGGRAASIPRELGAFLLVRPLEAQLGGGRRAALLEKSSLGV